MIVFAIEFNMKRCDRGDSTTPWPLQARERRLLEGIIQSSLEIVTRMERLIANPRRLAGGSLDDVEAYPMHLEVERLTDVVFVVDEPARSGHRRMEQHLENVKGLFDHATLH